MVTNTRNLCSAFNPSKCTHTVVNTPGAVGRVRRAVWGFGALLKGLTSVVVLKVRERSLFTPPLTIPAGPEIRTHNLGLQVRHSIHYWYWSGSTLLSFSGQPVLGCIYKCVSVCVCVYIYIYIYIKIKNMFILWLWHLPIFFPLKRTHQIS